MYHVVVNDEGQYSIWPAHLSVPAGWLEVGKTGTQEECLDHIGEVWTDMRPLSLITGVGNG